MLSPDIHHPEAWKAFKENCRVGSTQVLKMRTTGTTAGLEAASENNSTFRETESTERLLQVKQTPCFFVQKLMGWPTLLSQSLLYCCAEIP